MVNREVAADGALSIEEAMKFTSLGRSELYKRMDAGKLVFVKIGKRRLIPKRALVELLAANVVGGNQKEGGRNG